MRLTDREFSKVILPSRSRRRNRTALVVAAAALASSCAVGPNFHKPQAPANAGYAPTPLPDSSASAPVHGGEVQHFIGGRDIPFEWWQLFQSPALNSLIEKAFKANPTIAAAQAALAQAQELVYAQQGFYFPSVGATYQAERHKIAGNLTNDQAPGVQGNGDNLLAPLQTPGVPPYTAPLFYNFQTAELTVGFVPDVFGSNRRQLNSLPRRPRRTGSRWKPPTSHLPSMSPLPPSKRHRCVRRSARLRRSLPPTRRRCRSCAINSGWVRRCASTSPPRRRLWHRPRPRYRPCSCSSSRGAT